MPTYGLRPDDIVRDSRGDVMIDLKQTFYATRADAQAQVNPLGTATSAKDGKWQFTHTASGVFGRDPEGNIRFYDSEEPKLTAADGVLANPVLTVNYNPDGSVASTVENGVTTTFTYNTDGTVATQTRAGVTRTFSYSNGNVTGAA